MVDIIHKNKFSFRSSIFNQVKGFWDQKVWEHCSRESRGRFSHFFLIVFPSSWAPCINSRHFDFPRLLFVSSTIWNCFALLESSSVGCGLESASRNKAGDLPYLFPYLRDCNLVLSFVQCLKPVVSYINVQHSVWRHILDQSLETGIRVEHERKANLISITTLVIQESC